jgi:hypothetical protein
MHAHITFYNVLNIQKLLLRHMSKKSRVYIKLDILYAF